MRDVALMTTAAATADAAKHREDNILKYPKKIMWRMDIS
jgi:hypothetical protein